MKDDSISRKKALDTVRAMCDRCDTGDLRDYRDLMIEAFEALPSAQPGWIPTSDRLPKHDGDYLVTTHSGQIARYIFNGGSSEEYWRRCATAWMPLPEPWEGEQNG